ncbi:(Fe-S)-binding protein [Luteibaculum oceani]|uniref:(Fe-S)-binding protein n=1 Tax=Luteibaculum oceani TaxID=1294296 RepID=A0A5C6VAR2_9FLAO|nr:(Fe-S)-binding protein [Luteibaculum oceani]TXC81446.1 (Fe-S)-binding protein [Luteibaculum oceani]
MGLSNIVFVLILGAAIFFFAKQVGKIRRNILLGKDEDISDNKAERWKTMAKVALGQSKMVVRPVAGLMHIFVYAGFVIINLEVLEIILDGILGTHRVFHAILGDFYYFMINTFEIFAVLVVVGVVVFLIRRLVLRVPRFWKPEMKGWPTKDALYILYIEIILMGAFLIMNAADTVLMTTDVAALNEAGLAKYNLDLQGRFWVSNLLTGILPSDLGSLAMIERSAWWIHIIGILLFLNYLPKSKHFHIILAFPNTWYSNLKNKGEFSNLEAVTKEVKLMMDPNADPFAAGDAPADGAEPELPSFGAKDVTDLSWKSLMDAYTCTECGRCTSVCPANITGKKLSPRKVMMDTRDRVEELGKAIDKNGKDHHDGKALLGDYISDEELWACTTCNACTDACPVNIDPLKIIVELRRSLVMEASSMPSELTGMVNNIQNNAAPWAFGQADRANWINE